MKRLLSSPNIAEIGLLKTLLEAEGIVCTTRNQHLFIAGGALPFLECTPELWVVRDDDLARAEEFLSRRHLSDAACESWSCPNCGEENEGQFAACWQCEYLIDEAI